jgi:putative transposase
MVEKDNQDVSINKQCQLLMINRSTYYYKPICASQQNLLLMRLIDEQHLKTPFCGSRKMTHYLQRLGYNVCRKRVRRLMRLMNIHVIYQKPRTSTPDQSHKIYPYLLRNLEINKPNQVWCTDITYIPVKKGFFYLVAIMDWYSRKVLSWQLSNSMDTIFCIAALTEALEKYQNPEIFNSDQGSQFTSNDFTSVLQDVNIKISMDGKGRWMDNVFIERLWRSIKYECIYLQEFNDGKELKSMINQWINFYNFERPHQHFSGQTPAEMYYNLGVKMVKENKAKSGFFFGCLSIKL